MSAGNGSKGTSHAKEALAVVEIMGEPGRRSTAYKAWLSRLLSEKTHQAAFRRAITKDKHPHFMAATKHAAAYAEGLPVQPTVDLTPKEPAHLAAQQLAEALPRLVALLGGGDRVRVLQALEVDGSVVE